MLLNVLQIIASQDWEFFRSAVLSRPTFFRKLAKAISSSSELSGMTLLHAAIRFNAPIDIIVEMIRLCPDMPAAKDCLGRTPLHVAAGSKASPSLLGILAHAYPAACNAQEVDGMTPLHFVCDSSCVLFEEDHDECDTPSKQRPNHEAVLTLLSYSIHAATIEDVEEMSPLEHAIMSSPLISDCGRPIQHFVEMYPLLELSCHVSLACRMMKVSLYRRALPQVSHASVPHTLYIAHPL
jgi:hypothetical protein